MPFKNKIIYLSAFSFIWYIAFVHLLSNIVLVSKFVISQWIIYGAVALTYLIITYLLYLLLPKIKKWQIFLIALIPLGCLIITSAYSIGLNHQLYDVSFDGQAYHGEAIATLVEGWNPVYQISSKGFNEYADSSKQFVFLDAYPKMTWYHSTAIYDLTKNYRDIKFFDTAIIIPAGLLTYYVISRFNNLFSINQLADKKSLSKGSSRYHKFTKIALTALVVLNPIAINQATTSSVDGLIYYLLVMMFGLAVMIVNHCRLKQYDIEFKLNLVHFALLITVISNVKTAGLIYSIIFGFGFSLYILLTHLNKFKTILLTIGSGLLLAVTLFGYNPYITNIFSFNNPIYPVFDSKTDYFSVNTPINLRDKNNVEVFFYTLFSNNDDTEYSNFKLPFIINGSEFSEFKSPQPKKAGLGALFSGILILSFISAFSYIIQLYLDITRRTQAKVADSNKDKFKYLSFVVSYLFVCAMFVGSFIISKNSSSFRLIPHLWLLFVIQLWVGLNNRQLWSRYLTWVTIVLAVVNIGMMNVIYFSNQVQISNDYSQKLKDISTSGDYYKIYFGYSTGTRIILKENNVQYEYLRARDRDCNFTFKDYTINQNNETLICLNNGFDK